MHELTHPYDDFELLDKLDKMVSRGELSASDAVFLAGRIRAL
jgi:hypothetical protein